MKRNNVKFVFHFWIPYDFNEGTSYIYNLHLENIRRYSHIFTDCLFVLSMDNISDEEAKRRISNDIISLGFNCDVEIRVIENNPYIREAETFYNDVLIKGKEYDGIILFGHSKGMANINTGTIDGDVVSKESLYKWINSMYYFNLNWFDEVIKTLIGNIRIFYGALLSYNTTMWKKPQWQYNGSFFWTNPKKFNEYIIHNKLNIPSVVDRTYCENSLWKVVPFDFNYIESHRAIYLNTDEYPFVNPYENSDTFIRALLTNDEYEDFMKYNNDVINTVNNSVQI